MKIIVGKDDGGARLDQFLFDKNNDFSRSYFSNLIKDGTVSVNGKKSKSAYRVSTDDIIEYELIERSLTGDIKGEDIPLDVIYEDKNVIVINKQPGLVVHPAAGNYTGTLINALLHKEPKITDAVYEKGSDISESRPGLVHRLDKDTSGVMIVAKNTKSMIFLAQQIKDRKTTKIYLALCAGWPKQEDGELINFLGRNPKDRKTQTEIGENKGREAISRFKALKYYSTSDKRRVSLIQFQIKTGRTHQIRTQAKMAGFPILGDETYCSKESRDLSKFLGAKRQLLHANKLSIILPDKKQPQTFEVKPPSDFTEILDKLIVAE